MTHPGLRYHPAAKVALLLAVGIGAAHLFGFRSEDLLLSVAVLLVLLPVVSRFSYYLHAALLAGLVVVVGAILITTRGPDHPLLPPDVSIDRVNVFGHLVLDPRPVRGGWEWRMRCDSITFRSVSVCPEADLLVRVYDRRAGRVSLPRRGERVALQGDLRTPAPPLLPGEQDYGEWLASEGIVGTLSVGRLRDVWSLGPADVGLLESIRNRFHSGVKELCAGAIGGEEGMIALALVTGDRSGIDPELRRAFSATGTAHVLALSGLHVGVIALALFVLLSWVPRRWIRFGLFTAILAAYVLLTGAGPSILRASIMAVLFLLAYSIGRISQPLNTLGLAALIILLLDPSALFDVGFQLSFAAVGGIILFYGRLYNLIDRRAPLLLRYGPARVLLSLFLLSITAQIGTLPLIAYYFGEFSLLSPLLNIAVVPLITIGFGATCAGLLFSWIPGLPLWYGASASLALGWGIDLVAWGSRIDWQGVVLPGLSGLTALAMVAGVLWTGFARRTGSIVVRICSTLLLAFCLNGFTIAGEKHPVESCYLLPLNRNAGVVLLYHHADSLTLWYSPAWESDSGAVQRIAERFEQHFGTTTTEIVPVRGPRIDTTEERLIPINGFGPEYLDRKFPVILSVTERRPADIVRFGGERVLQVGLQGRTRNSKFKVQN